MEESIRKATIADIPKIKELWKELMNFHGDLDPYFEMRSDAGENFALFLESNIENKSNSIVMVAEVENLVVGYMMGMIQENPPVFKLVKYGEIMDACVSEAYRNNSIGENLFKHMRQWFKARNITRIDINAAAKNPISNHFWKKMGFVPYLNHMYFNNA